MHTINTRSEWLDAMYRVALKAQLLEYRPLNTQTREYVFCRDCVFFHASDNLGWSSSEMERAFGKHRHTIMCGVRSIGSLYDVNKSVRRLVRLIEEADPLYCED